MTEPRQADAGQADAPDGRPLYDVRDIMAVLPHRPPFLLVDRVETLEPWRRIRAFKNVTINEPFFQGHFPGLPVMPGVLIVEAMAQASSLLLTLSARDHRAAAPADLKVGDLAGRVGFFAACDGVKFRRQVVPGDRLDLEAWFLRLGSRIWKVAGRATVDGRRAAEAEMTAAY
ncbi:MAG: 3-hydroxyacyl-ACP dehydratase FabZ [Deltaproteobacteria bacterium]|jgi:beta-hydroxyacyl-ACP dehydratase FabZ|nr:3-hydroxyacyl-ACP dehydratase FabZ [Deltaproteobacteria bacterium]